MLTLDVSVLCIKCLKCDKVSLAFSCDAMDWKQHFWSISRDTYTSSYELAMNSAHKLRRPKISPFSSAEASDSDLGLEECVIEQKNTPDVRTNGGGAVLA